MENAVILVNVVISFHWRNLYTIQIVSPQDVLTLCGNTQCATHDGGQTWQPVASNLDFSQTDNRSIAMLDFLDANIDWALMMENDITTLYKTADGGPT